MIKRMDNIDITLYVMKDLKKKQFQETFSMFNKLKFQSIDPNKKLKLKLKKKCSVTASIINS